MKIPCIYILTNITNTVLYTGVTSNLPKRLWEHRNHVAETMFQAISREKQIKAGSRKKKEM